MWPTIPSCGATFERLVTRGSFDEVFLNRKQASTLLTEKLVTFTHAIAFATQPTGTFLSHLAPKMRRILRYFALHGPKEDLHMGFFFKDWRSSFVCINT